MEPVIERIQSVFRQVFDSEDLTITPAMTSKDIGGWDSLANIQLIVAVERAFSIRFTASEITNLTQVGDLIDLVYSKLP